MTMVEKNENPYPVRGTAPRRNYQPPDCVEPRPQGIHYPGMHYQLYMSAIKAGMPGLPPALPPRRNRGKGVILSLAIVTIAGALAFGFVFQRQDEVDSAQPAISQHRKPLAPSHDEDAAIAAAASLPAASPMIADYPEAVSTTIPAGPARPGPVAAAALPAPPPTFEPAVRLLSTASMSHVPAPVPAAPPAFNRKDDSSVPDKAVLAQVRKPESQQAGSGPPACSDALRAMQLCDVTVGQGAAR